MNQSKARARLGKITLPVALLVGSLVAFAAPAMAAGGPVVLMGIDAEDGGGGSHGPITSYQDVVSSVNGQVTNGGTGILVIGGGKSATDDVTEFWTAIGTGLGIPVTFVNGAANITSRSFAGFAIIAVVSSSSEVSSGGLTQAENNALAGRQADVAAFVNGGGGLIGFSQTGLSNPYAYITGLGGFTFATSQSYSNINPTPTGEAVGVTNALDVCCWHDSYLTFPSFLQVLATDPSGRAAVIGGLGVIVSDSPCTATPATPPAGFNVVTGTEGPDRLMGTAGNDVIFGLGGNDQIAGLGGDDLLIGGPGTDSITGGDGNDTVCGGEGRDFLYGDNGNDSLHGDAGDDDLFGGNGDDTLRGGDANDRLVGGAGRNVNDGGAGTNACSAPACPVPET